MDGELRIVHITKDEKVLNAIKDVDYEEIKWFIYVYFLE
jgi:hypothetical protein